MVSTVVAMPSMHCFVLADVWCSAGAELRVVPQQVVYVQFHTSWLCWLVQRDCMLRVRVRAKWSADDSYMMYIHTIYGAGAAAVVGC